MQIRLALIRQLRHGGRKLFSSKALPAISDDLHGKNFIAGTLSSSSDESSKRFNIQSRRRVNDDLPGFFTEASDTDIDAAVNAAEEATPGIQIESRTNDCVSCMWECG